jgi:hypothetical protein
MLHVVIVTVTLVVTLVSLSLAATGQVPELMGYQGVVSDASSGEPLIGEFPMTFRIYDVEEGGEYLWEEFHPSVPVSGGLFSVVLGQGTPPMPLTADLFGEPHRWLEIEVDGETITPRAQLASVPYSFSGSGASEECGWIDDDGVVRLTDASDKVGIGTLNPAAKLHVDGGIYTTGGGGDVNENDVPREIADLVLMQFYLSENNYLSERGYAEADVDGDGRVTSDDAAVLALVVDGVSRDDALRRINSLYGAASDEAFRVGGNVGIGTDSPQGALDVSSTTGALIVPRMTTTERDVLAPVDGMIIYNTSTNQFNFFENGAWVTK